MKDVFTLACFIFTLQALVAQKKDTPQEFPNPLTGALKIGPTSLTDTLRAIMPAAKTETGPEQLGPCDVYDVLQCGQTLYNHTNSGYGNKMTYHCITPSFTGPDHVYRVDVTEAGPYKFVLDILDPVDLDIFVISNCQTLQCAFWSAEDNAGTGVYREIADGYLAEGTYYVVVDGQYSSSTANYNLTMDCSCTPLEKDFGSPFARPFFCENFERFESGQAVEPQSSRWLLWVNPNNTTGGDGAIFPDSSGGNIARCYNDGVSNSTDLVYNLDDKTSGRWRLSWQMRVANNKSAYFNLLHTKPGFDNNNNYVYANSAYHVLFNADGTGDIRVASGNAAPQAKFTYPNGTWFNVVQIIDLYQNKVELWIDDNFISSWAFNQGFNYQGFFQSRSTIGGIDFYADDNNDYYIDNLTFWEPHPLLPLINCYCNEKLCIENGTVADGPCCAMTGFYTELEWGSCYSVCDLGGTFIYRGDTYSGQLDFSDIAPDSIRFDPCVLSAYGANMPVPLYADVFAFYNDDNAAVNVTLNTANPNDVKYFVFSCNYDIGGVFKQSGSQFPCTRAQKNLNCNGSFVPCDGFYYIVVTGPINSTYTINVVPPGNCAPNPSSITCGSTTNGSLASGSTGGYFSKSGSAYSQCYVGPRNYNGTEKVYQFTLNEPSQVKITVNSATPVGAFLYAFICGRNCMNYAENTGSNPQAQMLTSLNAGTYYIIVDRDNTTGTANFSLTLDCIPVTTFTSLAVFANTFLPNGAVCPSDNANQHQIRINAASYRFNNSDQLIFYYKNNNQTYTLSSPDLSELWGAPGPVKTINLPKDNEADATKCSFLPGDTIFLRIDPTDPGSLHNFETQLIFKPVPGTNATNKFQVNGVSYIDSIGILASKLFAASKSDIVYGPSDTSDVVLLQSNMPWTVTANPAVSWIKSISPLQSPGTDVITVKLLPQPPNAYLPRSTFLVFSTNSPQQEFQYQTFVRITQKGNCPPTTTAAINASASAICEGASVTLTAAGAPDAQGLYTYAWNPGGDTSAAITKMPLIPTTYTVTITNTNCNVTATATRQITVNPKPAAPTSLGNKSMCAGGTIPALQVSINGQPNVVADWYDVSAGGAPVLSGNSSFTPPSAVTKTYYAQSRNTITGCTNANRTPVTLTVNPLPNITVTEKTCAPNLLTYDVVFTTDANTVSASKGNPPSGGAGQYIITGIPKDSAFNITATFTSTGCSRTLNVTAPPCNCPPLSAPVSGGNYAICSDEPIPTLSVSVGTNETAYWYNANNVKIAEGPTYKPGGAGTFYVKAVNVINNCMSAGSTAVTLTVHPPVTLAAGTPMCAPNLQFYTVQLTTSLNVDVVAATQGTVSGGNGTYLLSNIPETSSVLVTATDSATGCQKQITIAAHDCPCPFVERPLSEGDKTACFGSPFPALKVTVNAGETADWFNAAGQLQANGQGTTSFTPLQAGTYYAQRRNLLTGCFSAERTAVNLSILPVPALAVLDDSCDPSLTTYQVTVSTDGDTVTTNPVYDVLNVSANTFAVAGVPVGTPVIIRSEFENTGCYTEQTVLRSDCPCDIGIPDIEGPNPKVICLGDALPQLVATVGDPVYETVDWFDVPAGGMPLPGGQATLVYKPSAPKAYYAEARKKDAPGCKSTQRRSVTILANTPPAVQAGADQSVCANEPVLLSGSVSGASSAKWEASVLGGQFLPNASTISGLTYTPPGGAPTVVLTLVSSDPPGPCPAVSDALTVTFKPIPEITVDTVYCSPDLLSYNVLCHVSTDNALVQVNAGTPNSGSNGQVLIGNILKNTDLVISATDTFTGCSNQIFVPKFNCECVFPENPVSKGDKVVCSNQQYPSLEVEDVPAGIAVDWYKFEMGGVPLVKDTLRFTPTSGGSYYAEARNKINNCTSLSRTPVTLTVKPSPVADAGANQTVCPGKPVVLTAAGTNYTYLWSNDATSKSITVPGSAAVYYVTVTLDGCSETDTVAVSTWPPVFSAINLAQPIDCFGNATGSLIVTASGGTFPYQVNWSNGPATPQNANLPAGTYTAVVTDAKQCRDTSEFVLSQPAPLEVSDTLIVESTDGKPNGSIDLTVSGGTSPYTYQWIVNGFLLVNEIQNTADSLIPANYAVIITDANGCSQTEFYHLMVPVLEVNPDAYVVVYPNPTDDKLYLQFHLQGYSDVNVVVTDQLGRAVLENRKMRVMGETVDLSLHTLPAGFYILHLQIDQAHFTYNICVKH